MAYAACAYLRASCTDGSVQVNLLAARSRVTPVKLLTIPRVELSGALLCTQLADWIVNQLQASHHTISVHYWSDAMIVLYWISGDPRRWKTFVSNRIGAILEASSPSQWRHVLTQENPADCATRGLTPSQLKHHTLWWNGPHWLHLSEEHWPVNPVQSPKSELISGEQSLKHIGAHISYVKRFIYNTRHKKADRLTGPIQVSEFQQALFALVRMVQQEVYSEELSRLRSNKFLSKHNKLSQLSPFLDDEGLMRVKGRLKNALQLSMSQRTPIILPKAHHLTILVIRNAHHNTLHGGVQLTLSTIHQVFWIINGKQAVKRILRQCVTCFKHRPSPSSQLMGDLPAHRVNPPKRAFEATGVDYTGAIKIKSSRFRGHTCYKEYIAVFICLASKAIHLEAVTGMSAQHFLWALQRLIGRRGFCQHLYSDCGTNFISSDKSLKLWTNEFYKGIEETVVPELTRRNIQWHFNPPHSPNFGGLWESNVLRKESKDTSKDDQRILRKDPKDASKDAQRILRKESKDTSKDAQRILRKESKDTSKDAQRVLRKDSEDTSKDAQRILRKESKDTCKDSRRIL
ncbi:uncharacterized protein [Drosophila suzukii]|uniref:Integrase zinc-binding domain-containing protein n=1 Tax=Drosophila suzukii TaxID=28584 RepID=A0ABM4TWW7_DROSZ